MKFRVFAMLMIFAMLLTGCAASARGYGRDMMAPQTQTSAPAAPAAQLPATSAPAATLTEEQAQAIALEHAGFTADQVNYLRTEFEIDDGVPQYEVNFHQGRWEYDYEISAVDGTILSWEKDD